MPRADGCIEVVCLTYLPEACNLSKLGLESQLPYLADLPNHLGEFFKEAVYSGAPL